MATRKPKGAVSIESYRGFLRLRWRLHGERYTINLGLPDDAINQQIAVQKAHTIKMDIISGNFDSTLKKYRDDIHLNSVGFLHCNLLVDGIVWQAQIDSVALAVQSPAQAQESPVRLNTHCSFGFPSRHGRTLWGQLDTQLIPNNRLKSGLFRQVPARTTHPWNLCQMS
ncbi:MAG: DUF3596 domain-containing protein [Cyanobacteria bacterium J06607_6]